MTREVLRSRSGCQRCRIRRKKCDERKPICGSCHRLNLHCTWHATATDGDRVTAAVRGKGSGLPTTTNGHFRWVPRTQCPDVLARAKNLGQGYQSFRDQVQFDLTMQSSASLRDLISQSANPDFQDTSLLITLALKNSWLRDALASFTAHQDNRLRLKLAPTLYQNAVSTLRSHIGSAQPDGLGIEVLGAMIFIGMSDSLGTGDATRALVRFQAAASMCRTLRFSAAKTSGERVLYRTVVECWLYHLSTLCLFHQDCDGIMRCIDWTVLDECFDESIGGGCISLGSSPFLGGSQSVYKLIMQMTWFARQEKPLRQRQYQKLIWSAELDMMQGRPRAYFDRLPGSVAQLYYAKFLLHIYALRIMLGKIADHGLSVDSELIEFHVEKAQVMLTSCSQHERKNPALAWPLIIFMCAANAELTFNFFVDTMTENSENFDEGHMRRMNEVLDTVREQRREGSCGLDLLLRKRGIFFPNGRTTSATGGKELSTL